MENYSEKEDPGTALAYFCAFIFWVVFVVVFFGGLLIASLLLPM